MANYYTKFSFVVEVSAAIKTYALNLFEAGEHFSNGDGALPDDFPKELAAILKGTAHFNPFTEEAWQFEMEDQDEGLWFHHDESGNVDNVGAFVSHLLKKLPDNKRVVFEWACDCSRPVLDGYGGGACVVTKDQIKILGTGDLIQKMLNELKEDEKEAKGGK